MQTGLSNLAILHSSYMQLRPVANVPAFYNIQLSCQLGRDSSVGIATRYELDGPGIESRWGRYFQHPTRPALGPTQPPVQWVPGHSRGKAAEAWR
jgi:hypothetical protein